MNKLKYVKVAFIFAILALLTSSCNSSPVVEPLSLVPPSPLPAVKLTPQPSTPLNDVVIIDEQGLDFAEKRVIQVYEKVAPSVVNITTQILRRSFFFGTSPEEGAGSGFVLDSDGHIVTNFHVIDGAQTIEVSFSDETTVLAELIGGDSRSDIAVLKIDPSVVTLVPVELGSSDNLRVGQRAIAIGNPFGQFGQTLTTGVISALDRMLMTDDDREMNGIIQTDTAINRGNSGGPLLDSAGRVIGMNTAIFSPSGTSAGVGFAIPVEKLRRVLPDLLNLGYYRRPWVGIRYAYQLTPGLARTLSLSINHGLLMVQLYDNAPIAASGIRGSQREAILGNRRFYIGGDILIAVDDHEITTISELEVFLEESFSIDDTVTLTIVRDGKQMEVDIILTEAPG